MRIGRWARLMLAAAPLIVGCKDFWQAPTDFTLTNSGNITVSAGSSGTSTITVTPGNSFTGTVTLSCAVTSPSGASNPTTCSLSSSSVSISSTTAETDTLTADTQSTTTTGAYNITVTGTSGSTSETTTVCVAVGVASSSCSSTASTSGVFYVLNQTTDEVVAFSISSGSLSKIGAYTLSGTPLAMAIAPNGKFLYVSTLNGIYLYTIGSSGALTAGNSGGTISGDQATAMQVDATNSWLVDAVSGYSQLNAIAINSSTGVLTSSTEQTFALSATTVKQLAISPNDSSSCGNCYVFVALGSNGTELIHFSPGSTYPFGNSYKLKVLNSGGANAVAVDPSNQLLYVGESDALPSATQTGGLRALTIASGGVTEISGSPYGIGGAGPTAILPTSNGSYVYVANETVSNSSDGNIASFSVTSSALTSIGTFTAGPSGQLGLAEDSTGSYLLAVDFAGSPDLEAYTMSSGTLTSTLTAATGTDKVGAMAIVAAP